MFSAGRIPCSVLLSAGRGWAASGRGAMGLTAPHTRSFTDVMNVFDRPMKRAQRDAAAVNPKSRQFDYLKNEVARRLVDRVLDLNIKEFVTGVDIGSGTGHIGKFLGDKGAVKNFIQLELSEEMLRRDMKTRWAGEEYGEAVPAYRQDYYAMCDEEFLPLRKNSMNIALSSLSLHWVNDLPGCLTQIRHSLKPDGVFIGAMLGGETLQELRSALALADSERRGGVQPHLSPFAQIRDCADLLTGAGFTLTTVDTETITIPYPDMFTLVEHLQGMAEQNAPVNESRTSRDVLTAAASIYEAMYADEDGIVPATFQVVYMIGWGPAESQPKPAARGSGKGRLSDLDDLLEGDKNTGESP